MVVLSTIGATVLATIENSQYIFVNYFNIYGSGVCCGEFMTLAVETILRDIFSVPLHISTGVIIGCGLATVYYDKKVSFIFFCIFSWDLFYFSFFLLVGYIKYSKDFVYSHPFAWKFRLCFTLDFY